jgi:hypothetical protein
VINMNFGRPDPATLGRPQEPSQAYSDSKACNVALALAWGRRLPRVASAAVDPGWVKTKLASAGAPSSVTSSADTLAYCCTKADLAAAPYWKDRRAEGCWVYPGGRRPVVGPDSKCKVEGGPRHGVGRRRVGVGQDHDTVRSEGRALASSRTRGRRRSG